MYPITHSPFVVFRGWWAVVSGTNTPTCDGRLTSVGWTSHYRCP